jgi:hypothetical protein
MAPSTVKKLKQLEDKNKRLNQMVADQSLDERMLQEVFSKNLTQARRRELVDGLKGVYRL